MKKTVLILFALLFAFQLAACKGDHQCVNIETSIEECKSFLEREISGYGNDYSATEDFKGDKNSNQYIKWLAETQIRLGEETELAAQNGEKLCALLVAFKKETHLCPFGGTVCSHAWSGGYHTSYRCKYGDYSLLPNMYSFLERENDPYQPYAFFALAQLLHCDTNVLRNQTEISVTDGETVLLNPPGYCEMLHKRLNTLLSLDIVSLASDCEIYGLLAVPALAEEYLNGGVYADICRDALIKVKAKTEFTEILNNSPYLENWLKINDEAFYNIRVLLERHEKSGG